MHDHWLQEVQTGRRTVTSIAPSGRGSDRVRVTFADDVEIEVSSEEADRLQRASGSELDRLLDALG